MPDTSEKTDLKLYATDPHGKQTTASITYVNPEATNTQLKTLGQRLNALTDNVYDSTYRVNTIHCDSEAGSEKQTPTFTLAKTTDTKANLLASVHQLNNQILLYSIPYSYNGDGAIFSHNTSDILAAGAGTAPSNSNIFIAAPIPVSLLGGEITQDVTFTFTAEETDNFKAASATFTITV